MQLYQNMRTTFLFFYLRGIGNEFLEYKLPFPNVLKHINKGYFIGWQINGYPGTQEAREYFNDIIARFLITFKDYYPEKLDFKPKLDKYTHIDFKNSYELQQFQNLKSIPIKKHVQKRAENVNTIDQTFWAIKYYTEELIREMGFVPYEMLEEFAYRHFYHKEKSTLRAKCRSIWNWYDKRDWSIPQIRSFEMTRSERAKKNAELKYKRARATILGFIQENLFSDEYKRGGKWNLTKLSKEIGIHRDTIRKHLKEMQEEGLI
jgi:hypothetical protein